MQKDVELELQRHLGSILVFGLGALVTVGAFAITLRPLSSLAAGFVCSGALFLLLRGRRISGRLSASVAPRLRQAAKPPIGSEGLLSGVRVSRRPRVTPGVAILVLALAVIWPGPLAALILVPIGYVLLEVRSGRATQRLRGNGLGLDHDRLVQTDEAGRELAAINLLEPFTYEYLYKDDSFAIYQLRQHGTLLEFTSDAEAAAWVVPHVLSAEWPPVNRPARHVGF